MIGEAYLPLAESMVLGMGLATSQAVVLRAGVFSLCTPAFASLGAYASAILVMRSGWPPAAAMIAALAIGTLAALAISIPLSRLRGPFQAIATIALIQIVVSLTYYAEGLTGGAVGLNGIPQSVGILGLLVFLACLIVFMSVLVRSGVGRAFDAIRQDETVAVSLGVDVVRYHMLAFSISGAIAGLSGSMIAFNTHTLAPDEFGFPMLVAALAAVVLGGRTSVAGPLVGVVVLSALPELLRPLAQQRAVFQGALLIAVIAFMPLGIVDTLLGYVRSRRIAQHVALLDRKPA